MVQIKVFDEEHEDDSTEVVNVWLQERADIRLMDIKFLTAVNDFEEEQIYCFSVMVIFGIQISDDGSYQQRGGVNHIEENRNFMQRTQLCLQQGCML